MFTVRTLRQSVNESQAVNAQKIGTDPWPLVPVFSVAGVDPAVRRSFWPGSAGGSPLTISSSGFGVQGCSVRILSRIEKVVVDAERLVRCREATIGESPAIPIFAHAGKSDRASGPCVGGFVRL